jgi:4-hydroxybenzoyl-CoA thioesterase/acyl-CoA thioester hydrolase
MPVRPEELPAAIWRQSVKIRFGHCDPAGIVYTPVYFDLFNAAVEDWFAEALGHDYHAIVRDEGIGLATAMPRPISWLRASWATSWR